MYLLHYILIYNRVNVIFDTLQGRPGVDNLLEVRGGGLNSLIIYKPHCITHYDSSTGKLFELY